MNWFSGNIAEAVALSKAKNSTFVVYCEGIYLFIINDYELDKIRHIQNPNIMFFCRDL